MATNNLQDVCLKILAASTEAEVSQLIEKTPAMNNLKNWRPLDGRETNFNVTSNQASDGGKALTELMTNMVDAVLMRHCYEKKIDPKGTKAPRTMYEAVDTLVKNLRGGKLTNLDARDQWLKDFASKNLVIGVTGARNKKDGLPCYTFVDNGEGQCPEDFPRTFLSLSAGNKSSIPFVQGKYNMGSSGVLGYCGRRWYKLIISRRHDGKNPWGWTLMRRRPDDGNSMPVAEYFVLPDGSIPSFETDMLYPFHTGSGNRYAGVALKTGTIIKLYDYNVGAKFLGFKGAREALNENLVETILPFRILDFRWTPDPKRGGDRAEGIDARPFYGMEFLLLRSHKEEGLDDEPDENAAATEEIIHVGDFSDPEIGKVSVYAIPLKESEKQPDWLRKSNNRVFHAVNGQVQFKQTRGYVSTTCKLPALKDRIVVIVDSSELLFGAHNEIWKGDREHVRGTTLGERYKDKVTETIKDSSVLKELQQKIAQQELKKSTSTESNKLFQKLVSADRNLALLLSSRDPTIKLPSSGGTGGSNGGKGEFEGKISPSFIRIEEKVQEKGLQIPLNRTRPIACKTDVENGYLRRADNCGRVIVPENLRRAFGIREHLHDGRLTIYFEPLDGKLKLGDQFEIQVGLVDPAMTAPVYTESFTVRIGEEEQEPKKEKPKTDPKSGDGGGKNNGTGQDAPTVGLPNCVLLRKNGEPLSTNTYHVEAWPEGFSEHDGGLIEQVNDNEVVYKINYDNVYHLNTKKAAASNVAGDVVTERYILGMRVLLLGYEHAFREIKKAVGDRGEDLENYSDEIRRMAARGAASTVLTLAQHLPTIVDKTAIKEEDE